MSYKIVLYNNGKKRKILHKSNDFNNIKAKFLSMVKKNEVLIPKRLVNSGKLKKVNYEILLLESGEVSKKEIVVRDRMGKIIRNREIESGWFILERENWKIEEKYTVFGRKKQMTCMEIIKELLLPNKVPKQVCCVLNKLVIEDDNDKMEVITCKDRYECGRLHDTLMDVCRNFNVTSIIFFGKATLVNRSRLFIKICDYTGWTMDRVYRSCTRTQRER
jgi:hypothetical protein